MMNTVTITSNNLCCTEQITQDLCKCFIDYIDATEETTRGYLTAIKQFMNYLNVHNISQPTRETVVNYRDELKERCKPGTVQTYIEVLKIFFKWTDNMGLYPNIAEHIKGSKITQDHKKDYLNSDQVKNVLSQIDRTTANGKRDYAIISLMITTGMRVIEVFRANIEDLEQDILYVQGKGHSDKDDYVVLPLEVQIALEQYLNTRENTEPTEPLFVSASKNSKNARLSKRSISGIAKKYMILANYDSERLTAHSLRHTAITLALQGGNTLQQAQQFARHTNIATTQIYAHNLEKRNNRCSNSVANAIF